MVKQEHIDRYANGSTPIGVEPFFTVDYDDSGPNFSHWADIVFFPLNGAEHAEGKVWDKGEIGLEWIEIKPLGGTKASKAVYEQFEHKEWGKDTGQFYFVVEAKVAKQ